MRALSLSIGIGLFFFLLCPRHGHCQARCPYLPFDHDGDGLLSCDEINIYKTDPFKSDTDGDGFSDFEEAMIGSDPLDFSDPSGYPIAEEEEVFDPLAAALTRILEIWLGELPLDPVGNSLGGSQ